ncbi:MAG: hypothetical protein ACI4QT_05435 [Kiritimatiellia bacterium]
MKKSRKIIAGIAVSLLLVFLFLEFCLGSVVKTLINNTAPLLLKTDVHVERVTARLFSGVFHIRNLRVGAPENFDANIFEMPELSVRLRPSSLFSNTILIDEIIVQEPILTYELKGVNSNFSALLAPFEKEQKPSEKEPGQNASAKKVVIGHFLFQGAKCRLAVANGKGAVVPLPSIELSDIGKKNGGITTIEALYEVLKSVSAGTVSAVGNLIGAVGSATINAASSIATTGAELVSDGVGAIADGLGAITGLFSGKTDKPAAEPAEPASQK